MKDEDQNQQDVDSPEEEILDTSEEYTGDIPVAPKESKFQKVQDLVFNLKNSFAGLLTKILPRKKAFQVPKKDEVARADVKITLIDKVQFKLKQWELEKLVQKIFDPNSRNAINKITIIALCGIGTYGAGKSLALILKGKSSPKLNKVATAKLNPTRLSSADIARIKTVNIFKTNVPETNNTGKLADTKKKKVPEICTKASRKSDLPIKLINTVVLQDEVKSVASVQVRGDKLESFRLGEKIQSFAKIDKITRLGLVVKNLKTGECESIESNQKGKITTPRISVMSPTQSRAFKRNQKKIKGISNDGNNFKISKKIINDQLKDLSSLLTQARAIKITNPDGTLSFKIVEIEPGGIFATLGVQNEDIITHINGRPISNMNEVMGLFSRLRNLSSLNLNLNRGGSDTELSYAFE